MSLSTTLENEVKQYFQLFWDVSSSSSLESIKSLDILVKTVATVPGVLADPLPEVDAVGFGDSSIDLMIRYWTLPQKVKVRQTKTSVIIALKTACEQADIPIPYPIRTLYYYNNGQEGDRFPTSANSDLG